MLDATMELISLVSSNSHLIFCFANLIIGILFVSNSKSVSAPSPFQKNVGLATTPKTTIEADKKQEDNVVENVCVTDVAEGASVGEEVKECNMEAKECDKEVVTCEDDRNDDGEEEDEDELRRRAEEFIEKINSAWKAEKFGACFPNVRREQPHGRLGTSLVM